LVRLGGPSELQFALHLNPLAIGRRWDIFSSMNEHGRHEHATENLQHSHEFGAFNREGERRTALVTWLTIVMMVVEIAAGWITGSMALLADGWHMGTHATALGIAWAAFVFARKHARNPRFTFGTGKVGILAAFGSAIILAGVAILMFWESGVRLVRPTAIKFDEALLVASIGLVVNLVCAWILGRSGEHGHSHHHDEHGHDHHDHEHGHHHRDHNMRAAYMHVVADAATSVLAIGALLVARQWGWMRADPLMGIVGGALILRWSWGLLRDTGHILVDGDIATEESDAIRQAIESDGDSKVTDLHVWRVGTTEKAAIVSLVTSQSRSPSDYRTVLRSFADLKHISIEVNVCPECAGKDLPTLRK
jgi:cation diffusion facilitator family transporter